MFRGCKSGAAELGTMLQARGPQGVALWGAVLHRLFETVSNRDGRGDT